MYVHMYMTNSFFYLEGRGHSSSVYMTNSMLLWWTLKPWIAIAGPGDPSQMR